MGRFIIVVLLAGLPTTGIFFCAPPAWAATQVPLVIDEPFADRVVAWPVTTGIPFPRGALSRAEHCRLVDETGAEQPLQSRVAATWDADRTSVRWLTIDFLARPGHSYVLEFGDDVRRRESPTPLAITGGKTVNVATGALRASFLATGPATMGNVAVDLDRDGQVEPDEVVASGAAGDHYYLDQAGLRYSSAADGGDRLVVIEAAGPVRGCVRVDGYFTGPGGQRIAKYRTRYHFFAGLPIVKVVDEFGIISSTKETRFRDIGFALDLRQQAAGRTVTVDASGQPGNQPLSCDWQPGTSSIAAFQTTYRHYGNPEFHAAVSEAGPRGARTITETDRLGEWLQVADSGSSVTGSLRWFWQQFPKEWEATDKQLVLHLWSPRAGELDFGADGLRRFFGPAGERYLRSGQEQHNRNPLDHFFYHAEVDAIARGAADGLGINKHHEFLLHFGPNADRAAALGYARLAALQPLALATGKWNCSTDVFGPLAPRPNDSPAEAAVDWLFDSGRRMQDEFGDYGWWLFGAGPHYSYQWDPATRRFYADSRRFEYHTYHKETQLWWNYLRSGERRFYDWAIPSENHWVDIAVSHAPTTIACGWRGGQADERQLHWRPGDWSIDSPAHYVRHHETAEAWLRGGAQFWASYHRTLETTTLAYYLTGDERFNDVIEYWRDYFGDLAGKTSASPDVQPWHREQAWFVATAPSDAAKTWAAMIRDYAPFRSGTRHQLTMFFNLATLYEHTWDPRIKQALADCAAAFLDPAHPIGVWRPQDSSLPAHAEAPSMGHFWTPALWKYERVTRDPRMPDILRRYFAAGYAADPFGEGQDVGVYSNSYLGYAYYFTRDPRHLALAARELGELLPFAQPLDRPQEINERLYNPYAPARVFAGAPRLLWALDRARQQDVTIPPPPLDPQRTAVTFCKQPGQKLELTLWGFEPKLELIGPSGRAVSGLNWQLKTYASEIQPFDRSLPQSEVYLHQVSVPADTDAGFYTVPAKLELAVLASAGSLRPLWNAARPIALGPRESLLWPAGAGQLSFRLESAQASGLRVWDAAGREVAGKVSGNQAEYSLASAAGTVRIAAGDKPLWMRIVGPPPEACWVAPDDAKWGALPDKLPDRELTAAVLQPEVAVDAGQTFATGRFGQAVLVAPGRTLHIPDYVVQGGNKAPLFDRKQGTIEFWVRKLWDERLSGPKPVRFLTNGLFTVQNQPRLPFGEWAHVALVWAPYRGDPARTMTYLYLNGRDQANYRSVDWEGYSSVRPTAATSESKWGEELISQALPGTTFQLDELRISSSARYLDPSVRFGPQQTFNPLRFQPPTEPLPADKDTLLLIRFDGSLQAAVPSALAGAVRP